MNSSYKLSVDGTNKISPREHQCVLSVFYCAVPEDHKMLCLSNVLLQYHFGSKESEMSPTTKDKVSQSHIPSVGAGKETISNLFFFYFRGYPHSLHRVFSEASSMASSIQSFTASWASFFHFSESL